MHLFQKVRFTDVSSRSTSKFNVERGKRNAKYQNAKCQNAKRQNAKYQNAKCQNDMPLHMHRQTQTHTHTHSLTSMETVSTGISASGRASRSGTKTPWSNPRRSVAILTGVFSSPAVGISMRAPRQKSKTETKRNETKQTNK